MAAASSQGNGEHVLVVEDEDDLSQLVRINLEIAGYTVDTASDGAEALASIRSDPPDLVLLDVMMPVLDGWQVLRSLKEDDATQDIPVVMLTALSQERDFIRGHLQGAIRYVTKPFEMATLLRAVEEGLSEPDEEERDRRRERVRTLLQRLAELDSGRTGEGGIRWSKIERAPQPTSGPQGPTDEELTRLTRLTDKQRYIAEQLGRGRGARELADELGVSRSNIYATRKRIARKLGVAPDDVADTMARLLEG
jgi:DNA-binding response OmpR family regulator